MDRQQEILAAIGAIGDRLDGLENRFDDFDSRLRLVEQKLDRVDHRTQDLGSRFTRLDGKLNAIARKLLSPPETTALGISDPRVEGPAGGNSAAGAPIAARSGE